jgi:GNAT superfamily N-acetyltransferase
VKQIQIKPCSEDDVDAVGRFIDTQWQRGHILAREQSLLRWQFDPTRPKGDARPGLSILLAWHGDRIVGMLGHIGFEFNVRGTSVPGVWLSHWLTTPDVRADGVGLRLLWAIHDLGVGAVFVLGINETAGKVYAPLGFELLSSLPRWIGVFDAKRSVRLLEAAHPGTAANDLDELCARYLVELGRERSSDPEVQVVEWSDPLAAAWDSLWIDELAPTLLSPSKDSSYIRWRYIDHPMFTYEIRLARNQRMGNVLGLAVFRVERIRGRSEKVLRLVEFLATAQGERALTRSLVEAAKSHGTIFADFYCASERAAHALERIGFRRHTAGAGPGFPSRFQPMEAGHSKISGAFWVAATLRQKLDPGKLLASNDFYITKSDGDQDRPN